MRKWDPQSEPAFFLQQLHFRALNLRTQALCPEIETQLQKDETDLVARAEANARESSALLRTLEGDDGW